MLLLSCLESSSTMSVQTNNDLETGLEITCLIYSLNQIGSYQIISISNIMFKMIKID